MFLAWSELKKNKLRFSLITAILVLVSFLVFFLSGLATGLANLNREAVDKWQAEGIILTEESDTSLPQSSFLVEAIGNVKEAEIAIIGQLNTIASNGSNKKNISLFGISADEFIMPEVTAGKIFSNEHEVIASDALKNDGFELGDSLHLASSDVTLTIVGFTDQARFNAAPVVYLPFDELQNIKFGEAVEMNKDRVNGLIVRSSSLDTITVPGDFELIEMENFIQKLPGYTEQNMTLKFMIYFLFIISAAIVAIFLYVLTVQKISMFGVMKAQGISNGYLARSVIAQTFLLSAIGVSIGFTLTITAGKFLPSAVPVSFHLGTLLMCGLVLITVAIAGALISVWTIVKIDPLEAIGG